MLGGRELIAPPPVMPCNAKSNLEKRENVDVKPIPKHIGDGEF